MPNFSANVVRALDDRVGDRHELAARVALVAGQVRELGPRAGAEHPDAHRAVMFVRDARHLMTGRVSPGSSSCRCAQIGAMPFVITRSWNSRRLNVAPMLRLR